MSLKSYKANVAAGVTGRDSYTCFVAALEQISPMHAFDPSIYLRYTEVIDQIETMQGQDKRRANPLYKQMFGELATAAGYSYDDLIFRRLRTLGDFCQVTQQLLGEGKRVVVDIIGDNCDEGKDGVVHSVGLSSVRGNGDGVRLRSTWLPPELAGVVGLEELFPHVSQVREEPRVRYAFNDANLVALPY